MVAFQCHGTIHQYPLAAQKTNPVLGYVKLGVARSSEVILSLMRPHLECCMWLWGPKKDVDLEQCPRTAMKMSRGLEYLFL